MTIDEKAFEATEALYPWGRVAIRTAEDRKLILAYEAAKPAPASGGVEAVREALFEEALVGHFGTSNTTTFTAREAGRQAAIVVRDLFAVLASSTPAEAEPASSPATMEGVRELRLALANLTDAFLNRHGCFPLDKTNDKERHWCAAMSEAYRLVGQPGTPARYAALAATEAKGER